MHTGSLVLIDLQHWNEGNTTEASRKHPRLSNVARNADLVPVQPKRRFTTRVRLIHGQNRPARSKLAA